MILQATFRDKYGGFIQHHFLHAKNGAGFTIIELLIVIGITLVLTTASVPIYGNLQVLSQLNDSRDQIIQTVRIARTRSVAGLGDSSHGVYFEINPSGADRFILFQGDTYASRDPDYDRAETLSEAITISTTLSGAEIFFSKGLGAPSTTGTLTLTHDAQGSRSILINNIGSIELQ